uniref:Uncharacterized protein n=1 Tax=Cacopsylla melanoneura TaxID=428564 RepID=A0A8D9F7H0_9HEMI
MWLSTILVLTYGVLLVHYVSVVSCSAVGRGKVLTSAELLRDHSYPDSHARIEIVREDETDRAEAYKQSDAYKQAITQLQAEFNPQRNNTMWKIESLLRDEASGRRPSTAYTKSQVKELQTMLDSLQTEYNEKVENLLKEAMSKQDSTAEPTLRHKSKR